MPADTVISGSPTTIVPDSIDSFLADSAAAQESFFQQASDAFDAQARSASQAATMPADKPSAASAAPAPAAQSAATPTAKPAIPAFKSPDSPAPAAPSEPSSDEPPREYRAGSIKKDQWEKLHSLRDADRAAAEAARQELATIKARTGEVPLEVKQRFEAMQKERDEYQKRLESVAVERSPRFNAQFQPRIEGALAVAKSVVSIEKQEHVAKLLQMPDSEHRTAALEQVAEGLTGLKQGRFANAVAEIDRVNGEKAAAAANSSEIFRQWTAQQQQAEEQQRASRIAESESTLKNELQGFGDFFVGDKPEVRTRSETAKQIFLGGLSMDALARASAWAAIAPELHSQLTTTMAELASVKADYEKLRGAQPGSGTDAAGAHGGTTPDILPNTGYGEAIAQAVRNAGITLP